MARHFGILIPSTNTTCEAEFSRLGPDLQAHAARLGKGGDTPFSPSIKADVTYHRRCSATPGSKLLRSRRPRPACSPTITTR
jgi:hypothetical protein